MSNFVISLLVGLGTATWIYTKFQNKTGNNTKTSIIASGVAGVIIFIVLFSGLSMIIE